MIAPCNRIGGWAEWRCILDAEHDGDHRDALDRTWEIAVWEPVVAAEKITERIAGEILARSSRSYDVGTVDVDGVMVGYYAVREHPDEAVWFFNPGDEPEFDDDEVIARFEVERTVVRA